MVCPRNEKGSLTVEAAIAMPVFISVIISIIFIIKLYYVHEIMQHAISETANEIAAYSYIYAVSGIQGVDDTITSGLDEKKSLFQGHLEDISEGYNSIKSFSQNPSEALTGVENIGGTIKEGLENPKEELISILSTAAEGAYENIKVEGILKPLINISIKKYLNSSQDTDIESRLKNLNILNSFQGLDFSQSKMLEDGKNIDIIVRYKLNLPLPVKLMPDIYIIQRARVRAWLTGDGNPIANTVVDSVWNLDQRARGIQIQKMQGRNLPNNYPVIAKFENGIATSIKSMNIEDASYLKTETLKKKVKGYINELSEFKGAKNSGTTIEEKEIKSKKLNLIIPEVEISEKSQKVFDECVAYAKTKGITLNVIKAYGKKQLTVAE